MRNTRSFARFGLGAVFAVAMSATALSPMAAQAADAVLSGTIKSAGGEALGGITVSARADGSNIVTSVFTDVAGNYYFPPMAGGKYKMWAHRPRRCRSRRRQAAGLHPQAVQGFRPSVARRHGARRAS